MVDKVTKKPNTRDSTVLQRQPFQMDSGRVQAHLRILETTDLHLNLLPYDYYTQSPTEAEFDVLTVGFGTIQLSL